MHNMLYFLLVVCLALGILSLDGFNHMQEQVVQPNYFEHDQQTTTKTSTVPRLGLTQAWGQASDLSTCSCPPSCNYTIPDSRLRGQANWKTITECNALLICPPRAPIIQGYTQQHPMLVTGNGFYASPNMVSFCERMVEQELNQARIDHEIRQGLRPAPRTSGKFSVWDISDRHWQNRCPARNGRVFICSPQGTVPRGQLNRVIAPVPVAPSEKSTVYLSYKRFPAPDIYKKKLKNILRCMRFDINKK